MIFSKSESRKQMTEYRCSFLLFCCLFILLIESGCLVGPKYKPQEVNAPPEWIGTNNTSSPEAMLIDWWKEFNDPNLTILIEQAIKSNLDIKQAEQRIRQARANLGVVQSAFWPKADATASYTRNRLPSGVTDNLFQTGLDAAWELDIFGQTRRNIEAAEADVNAAIWDRRDVLITLVSELATNYMELRGFQQEIIIANNNLKVQKKNASVVRMKYEGGFVSALDAAYADAQVATTSSQIPVLETSAQQTIYNIAVLLGEQPGEVFSELSNFSHIPPTPPEVPAGLPSEMLRRRPDIRQAEAQIRAANALIGAAVADYFPKFNLAGTVSMSATRPRELRWDQRSWSFGPFASWEIFTAGRVSSNVEVQKALYEQAVLTYQKNVLTAIQDVENALISFYNEQEHRKALTEAVRSNRKAVELSMQLYSEGQTDFLSVLDAQRSLYVSEDALVQSTRNLSIDLIALYKALGGGWENE